MRPIPLNSAYVVRVLRSFEKHGISALWHKRPTYALKVATGREPLSGWVAGQAPKTAPHYATAREAVVAALAADGVAHVSTEGGPRSDSRILVETASGRPVDDVS